jgi:hypothetical protein
MVEARTDDLGALDVSARDANEEIRAHGGRLEPTRRELARDGAPQPIFCERVLFIGGAVGSHQRAHGDIERSVLTEVVVAIEVHTILGGRSHRQREKR